jgi:hypothetical protein
MGRPSLPADLVGSVLVLKELYDLSDAQTAEALKFDIRWKVACGRSLTQMSFDASTLVYWRRRIAASKRPDRVFDAVAAVIAETGILRGRRKRCVDSTVFDDAVATQDGTVNLGGWVCGGACQCPVVIHSVVVSGGGQADDLIPGGESGGHFAAVGIGAKTVAAGSEVRGDAAERREEPLRVPGRGELLHRSFPCSGGLVGVLGPVVQIL